MRRAASSHRIRAAHRPAALVAALVATAWLAADRPATAAAAALPELVRTTQRTFSIPFRLPKPQDPDADAAAERVRLEVSTDLGGTWSPAGESAPSATAFSYTAQADGEYWFRLRAVDRKGRMRGGEGPDMRVLVDAAGPRLAARVWKGADGEIVCRYTAVDDSIDLKSLTVEYRVGTGEWKTVATEGILARQAPAHVVGEDIWWAGEKVDALTVRIAVADASGNRTAKQFTMEPADPGVDQAALAAEVGVPPLPGLADAAPSAIAATRPGSAAPAPASLAAAPAPGAWPAETATWSGGEPGTGGRSVLVRKTVASSDAARPAPHPVDASRLLAPAAPSTGVDGRLEYRGRPLQLSRSRRFAWDYEPPAGPADGRKLRAELWSTRDGGLTWQRAAVDADGVSPIDVELPAPGLYGFRLEMVVADAATGGPRSGDAPETWVGIDEEAPHVELLGVTRDDAADAIVIRWAARDPLLPPKSARILYSPHAEGPWATVVDSAENHGEYRWQPDRSVPAKVFVRVEVTDAAGNLGAASSAEAVAVSQSRFVGRLGGLKPLPPPAP
jgi:hypothetical protein